MKALAIAGTNLRRLVRERANIFFLLILPMLIILLLGAVFGSADARIGVVAGGSGQLGDELVASLQRKEDLAVERFQNEDALGPAVERGRVQAGLVVPSGYDSTLRSGGTATLRYFARPDSLAQQLRATVESVVAEQSTVLRAARFAVQEVGGPFDRRLQDASRAATAVPGVRVEVTAAGEALFPADLGRFELSASTQLVLFIFLTSLTSATSLIEVRRLGLSRRMLSTPTPTRTIVVGEALGRLAVALTQALLIVLGSALLFRVGWGAPLGTAVLVLVFCLVGSGFGMLIGSTLANEQQAGAIALILGLGLAALGGSMVPLEVFPEGVRSFAHVTPHAWANDAFAELVRRDGGLLDILPELGALLAFAAAAFALAVWRFRRAVLA